MSWDTYNVSRKTQYWKRCLNVSESEDMCSVKRNVFCVKWDVLYFYCKRCLVKNRFRIVWRVKEDAVLQTMSCQLQCGFWQDIVCTVFDKTSFAVLHCCKFFYTLQYCEDAVLQTMSCQQQTMSANDVLSKTVSESFVTMRHAIFQKRCISYHTRYLIYLETHINASRKTRSRQKSCRRTIQNLLCQWDVLLFKRDAYYVKSDGLC